MAIHGNSNTNNRLHHLYEIRDSEDDEVFKYGISHDEIDPDGYSNRMRTQVDFLNLGVKYNRFFARVLRVEIEGRVEAKRIEHEYIQLFKQEKGTRPRGNKED